MAGLRIHFYLHIKFCKVVVNIRLYLIAMLSFKEMAGIQRAEQAWMHYQANATSAAVVVQMVWEIHLVF
jgi:hypothetical protein